MHDKHDLNFCIIQLSAVWHSTQGLMPSLLYALAYTKCFVSFSMPCPTHLPRLLVHPHPPHHRANQARDDADGPRYAPDPVDPPLGSADGAPTLAGHGASAPIVFKSPLMAFDTTRELPGRAPSVAGLREGESEGDGPHTAAEHRGAC